MSMTVNEAGINFIGGVVTREKKDGKIDWSLPASQTLAQKISALVQNGKINIRIVQPGDNLGRIAEGLSQRDIKLIPEGGRGWEEIKVEYRGTTAQIKEQREKNPSGELMKAGLIYKDQIIYLKDQKTLIVAATLADLKPGVIVI